MSDLFSTSPPVNLTSGRTILHRREPNGSQFAFPAGDTSGEMTAAEWDEYCAVVAARRSKPHKLAIEPQTQGKLFSGLDCLPGQEDLFDA